MVSKENMKKCWYKEGQTCKCEKGSDCIELRMEHARLTYCNDSGCAFNQELPDKVKIEPWNFKNSACRRYRLCYRSMYSY